MQRDASAPFGLIRAVLEHGPSGRIVARVFAQVLLNPEERFAQAPGADVAEPAHVLDRQRIAQAEVRHDPLAVGRLHLRVAFDAEDDRDERVPGQDPQDREDSERDAEQSDGGVDRPTGGYFRTR